MTADPSTPPFGALLKRHRLACALSQEALAERAGISLRAVSDLERGLNRTPRKDTLALLLSALPLSPEEQGALVAAASTVRAPLVAAPTTEAGPARSNLPRALTSFIGRERDLAEVSRLLDLESTRLLTLTGTGGVGKTRLALQVAAGLLDRYPQGVWLAELAPLADPAGVPQAVATAVGVREEAGQPLRATLVAALRPRQLLLVLDNCEHLIAACADLVSTLLGAAPGLRILATSREGMGVAGEQLYRVPSLAVPDPQHLPPPEVMGSYEAVRLFVARARARRRDFALDAGTGPLVAAVCARLDGIPLAIELAAARVGGLPIATIAARLDQSLGLLTGGPRDALPRQQTLRATLDWSWALLGAGERALLRRLAVFADGWTLEAAEAVCAGAAVEAEGVVDLLAALVEKSLAVLEVAPMDHPAPASGPSGAAGRYRLLEPVRQYAAERLLGAVDAAAVGERYLAWCLSLAEEAELQLTGPEQGAWLMRLEAEHDNLRAALGRSLADDGAAAQAMRLAARLAPFWLLRGHLSEGRRWLEATLARGGPRAAPTVLRARALGEAGFLAARQGDQAQAGALLEESLAQSRALDDQQGIARSLNRLGIVAWHQSDYPRAAALHEEALALFRALGNKAGSVGPLTNLGGVALYQGDYARAGALFEEVRSLAHEMGDRFGLAVSLRDLGTVAFCRGDYARAWALQEEALTLFQELGNKVGISEALCNLGVVAQYRGDYAQAWVLQEEALALFRELGNKDDIPRALGNLGWVAYLQGEYGRAETLLEESLLLSRDIGARVLVAESLESLTRVAAAREQPRRAARLGATAAALREDLGVLLPPAGRADHEQAVQALRAALGEEVFAAAWAEGQGMPLEVAIALALEGDVGEV